MHNWIDYNVLENDMRCGWHDVVLWFELILCWDHEIHIHMSFGDLIARIQGVGKERFEWY